MDSHSQRHWLNAVVLIGCVLVGLYGQDRTPTRNVVEMVSVVYKPARSVPAEMPATLQAEAVEASHQVAVSDTLGPDELLVSPVAVASAQADHVPKAVPARALHAAAGTVRTAPNFKGVVRASCRAPGCTDHADPGKAPKRHARHAGGPDAVKHEAKLPEVFVPIRRLGLYLQARTGGPAKEGT
jgi:hypothetical protein